MDSDVSCDHVQVIFLFMHMIVTFDYIFFCPMRQFRSRTSIFFNFLIFKCKVRFEKYYSICQMYNQTISDVLNKILHYISLYYQPKGVNL